MAIGAGAALLIVLACTKPTSADDFCAADVNADGYADIFDVTAMVHYFGQSAPLEYDIHPPLQPDGYVDIYDIIEVTQHFGLACFGFTATETQPQTLGEPQFLQECSFKAEGWWASTSGSWANIWPYMGASNCLASPGLYSTRCAFEFLADQNGWVVYITTPIKTYAGTWCESSGIASANLPMWTPLHEQVCFEVSRDGHVVKPWRCIPKPSPFFIPCNPQAPPNDPSNC